MALGVGSGGSEAATKGGCSPTYHCSRKAATITIGIALR